VIGRQKRGKIRGIRRFHFAENSRKRFLNSNERASEIGTSRGEQENRRQVMLCPQLLRHCSSCFPYDRKIRNDSSQCGYLSTKSGSSGSLQCSMPHKLWRSRSFRLFAFRIVNRGGPQICLEPLRSANTV
jgi:hypothetical protein